MYMMRWAYSVKWLATSGNRRKGIWF